MYQTCPKTQARKTHAKIFFKCRRLGVSEGLQGYFISTRHIYLAAPSSNQKLHWPFDILWSFSGTYVLSKLCCNETKPSNGNYQLADFVRRRQPCNFYNSTVSSKSSQRNISTHHGVGVCTSIVCS